MKKLLSILFLFAAFKINAQTLVTDKGIKIGLGTNLSVTSDTLNAAASSAKAYAPNTVRNDSLFYTYNILAFGASPAASAATNTAAINAAIVAAGLGGNQEVHVPEGIFDVNTITYNPLVAIIGEGQRVSVLRSASAVPLLQYNSAIYKSQCVIKHIGLDGNSVGTIGLNLYNTSGLDIDDIFIGSFTTYGMFLKGVLVGSVRNSSIQTNVINIKADSSSNSSIGPLDANLITFTNCIIGYATTRAVDWRGGAMNQFLNCDFESNGTNGDAATGVIKTSLMASAATGVELLISGCWFENNFGTIIDLGEPSGSTQTIIQNTTIQVSSTASKGISLTGASTSHQLLVSGTKIDAGTVTNIFSTGANALVRVFASSVATHSENSGSSYIDLSNQLTFSTGLTNTSSTITSNLSTGVSGGQSVIGGTASGNSLTLSSTSHATKGKILFGASAYDEVNNRLGIGTTSPTTPIDIISTNNYSFSSARTVANSYNVFSLQDGPAANSNQVLFGIDPDGALVGYSTGGVFLAAYKNGSGTARNIYLMTYDAKDIVFLTNAAAGTNIEKMRVKSGGDVVIANLAGTGSRTVLAASDGTLSAPVSDRRVKENILPLEDGLSTIMKLKPSTFTYKDGWKKFGEGKQVGFIAQDVKEVMPNSTYVTPDTKKMGYNEIDMIPVLVKAVQELNVRVEALEAENKKLKSK